MSKPAVRKLSVADLPPEPHKQPLKFYREPHTKKIGMDRKKGESDKAFTTRALKKFFKEHCMQTTKWCSVDNISQLDKEMKGKKISKTYKPSPSRTASYSKSARKKADREALALARQREVICIVCPSNKAPDDVWIKWGEYYGFKFDLSKSKKSVVVSREKPKPKPTAKKPAAKPKPKSVKKPALKKVVKKPVKKTVKKVVPAKKDGKKTTLNYAQLNKLIENGFVNIKIGGKTRKIKSKDINNKGQVK